MSWLRRFFRKVFGIRDYVTNDSETTLIIPPNGPRTITLPAHTGREIVLRIKNASGEILTIQPSSQGTIHLESGAELHRDYKYADFDQDGNLIWKDNLAEKLH